ncbi:MAG TPA: hypothetical protein VM367_14505 [Pseudonocardia sp.]|nr:hypothetical protein [Pseudonocardia sp.]
MTAFARRRVAVAAAGLATVVTGCGGAGEPAPGAHVSAEVPVRDRGAVVQVGVEVDPAGPDDVIVLVTDPAGERVEVPAVTGLLAPPGAAAAPVSLGRMEPGHLHGVADLDRAGEWRLELTIGDRGPVVVPVRIPPR